MEWLRKCQHWCDELRFHKYIIRYRKYIALTQNIFLLFLFFLSVAVFPFPIRFLFKSFFPSTFSLALLQDDMALYLLLLR